MAAAAPVRADWLRAGIVRHTFTHFHLELEVWRVETDIVSHVSSEGWWSLPSALSGEALPTVMKKAITAALPDAFTRFN